MYQRTLKSDFVIVGGGPVGLKLADELKKEYSVVVVESRNRYSYHGYRVMSIEAFKKWSLPKWIVKHKITKITMFSPSFEYSVSTSKKLRGFVVDKGDIERYLLSKLSEDTEIFLGASNWEINKMKKGFLIKPRQVKIKYQWLIGADGPCSRVRAMVTPEKPAHIVAFTTIHENLNVDSPSVFFPSYLPGFYGWIIPTPDVVEVGVGVFPKVSPASLLRSFREDILKKTNLEFDSRVRGYSGGVIPIEFISKVAQDSSFLVGDSTGGEPLLGSSLHKGIEECRLLINAIKNADPTCSYQTMWSEVILGDLKRQMVLRNVMYESYRKLEYVFKLLNGSVLDGPGLINGPFRELISHLSGVYL